MSQLPMTPTGLSPLAQVVPTETIYNTQNLPGAGYLFDGAPSQERTEYTPEELEIAQSIAAAAEQQPNQEGLARALFSLSGVERDPGELSVPAQTRLSAREIRRQRALRDQEAAEWERLTDAAASGKLPLTADTWEQLRQKHVAKWGPQGVAREESPLSVLDQFIMEESPEITAVRQAKMFTKLVNGEDVSAEDMESVLTPSNPYLPQMMSIITQFKSKQASDRAQMEKEKFKAQEQLLSDLVSIQAAPPEQRAAMTESYRSYARLYEQRYGPFSEGGRLSTGGPLDPAVERARILGVAPPSIQAVSRPQESTFTQRFVRNLLGPEGGPTGGRPIRGNADEAALQAQVDASGVPMKVLDYRSDPPRSGILNPTQ